MLHVFVCLDGFGGFGKVLERLERSRKALETFGFVEACHVTVLFSVLEPLDRSERKTTCPEASKQHDSVFDSSLFFDIVLFAAVGLRLNLLRHALMF